MSEVMKGSSLILPGLGPPVQILPQRQAPQLSCASTSTSTSTSSSTVLSSHFHPYQWVRQRSSHTIRHQPQRSGRFCVKQSPSSFHGDARALKQLRQWPEEKLEDAFNSYFTREPKGAVGVQPFNRLLNESHRPSGDYPSVDTQLPTALEAQFPSASVDQTNYRDFNAPGNLDQSTSSSTLEVVLPGSKASSKRVPSVRTISEHRRSQRAEKSISDQRVPSPNIGRPGTSSDTSYMRGRRRLPRSSRKVTSGNSNPNSSTQMEAGVESKTVISNERRDGGAHSTAQDRFQSRGSYGSRAWSRDSTQVNGSTTSEAIAVLQSRLQQGIRTDSYTYAKVLQMCLNQKDLLATKQVHDCIIESGMDKDPYVASTLLNVYIKSGELLDARRVFDNVEKKCVKTWTMMITGYAKSDDVKSAVEIFELMLQEGPRPNAVTYLSILKAFASPLALTWGKSVHECIRRAGFESDVRVGSALLQMYAKCGCITEARRVFDRLKTRDVRTWTIMIGAYAEHGSGVEAYRLFLEMRQEGFEADAVTYLSILNASASAGALEWVKEVHGHASEAGLESDLRVCNALVHMYAKSGSIDDARLLFDRMERRDLITWNIMVGSCAESGRGMEAYRLFLQMRREGFEPAASTYVSILNASSSAGALEWVKKVHGHALKAGLESDLRVCNALVHMYAKSGSIDDARLVFDRMERRDLITWNIMVGSYAESGHGMEAYRLFLQMRRECFEPDAFTYVSILNASSSAGALDWVKKVHAHVCKAGLEMDFRVGTALVHMYAKSGSIDDARRLFDRMQRRDVVTWTAMIGGLAQHGCGHEALELFRKMIVDRVKPNAASFVAVLAACCHGGLVEDGRRIFSAMAEDYDTKPDIVHYTCMVDLLGRAGHLEEAKRFINDMPVEPDDVIWTALLGACRTHGNIELAELAAKEIFKLNPSKSSTYVLLSNIYAAAGEWEKVSSVRTMMQERGVRKEPGRSWIEVDNKVHEFIVGDTSHPEAKTIYTELNKMTEKLKAEGYIPDTRLVLHDINEEDKELALCSHSEKLAIVYGLMHLPRGEPIRVRKNLRVCPDCHTATKFISKVTGREIITRDASRFHHFKDGLCSCGDYW